MAGLAELIRDGDAAGATTNDDVVVCCLRSWLALRSRTAIAAGQVVLVVIEVAWLRPDSDSPIAFYSRSRGRQRSPVLVLRLHRVLQRRAPLPKPVIMELERRLIRTRRVLQPGLRRGAAQHQAPAARGHARAVAVLVPGEAVLAAVQQLEARRRDVGRDLGEFGVARVDLGQGVASRVAERRVNGALVLPGDEEQGLRHLAGLAVREATPAGGGSVGDLAALECVSNWNLDKGD